MTGHQFCHLNFPPFFETFFACQYMQSRMAKKFKWPIIEDLNKVRLCTFWYQTTFKACKENLKYACELRRLDLAKIWRLCCKVAQLKATSEHFSVAWSLHPLGKPLLKSIIDHCINSGKDILGCQVHTYYFNRI